MMDYTIDDVIFLPFTTRAFATGIPTVLTGSQTVEIYEDAGTTPIVEGASKLVLTISLNSVVGFNMATVTLSAANGFEAGKHYSLIIKTGTVGGVSVVGEVVGEFTIGWSAAAVDLANATDGLGALKTLLDAIPTTAMRGTDGANTTTPPTSAANATAVVQKQLVDAFASAGTMPTVQQAIYALLQAFYEQSVAGTTETIKAIDGSTARATNTLDDATNPTSRTRTT